MPERVDKDMEGAAEALDRDAELMLRVKEGDGASFDVLLQKHSSPVIHFLYRMVQNQAVAEELAQEVFLRVYRSRATYEPTAKFTTWLFRIATHLALNALRDGKHERAQERLDEVSDDMPVRQVADNRPSVEQSMVYQARLDEVRQAVAALPGQAARRGADAQVRRDGIFADRQGFKLLRICGEVAVIPGVRIAARPLSPYGLGKRLFMNCPLGTREELLVAYSSRQLDAPQTASLELHLEVCSACREFVAGQRAVWEALDLWEPAAVSPDFNRLVYSRH